MQKFPLITSCHLYMLCTCVSQRGYGEADENTERIDNTALMRISTGIYQERRRSDDMLTRLTVPPMAIVITKIDMAACNTQCQENDTAENNPFSRENMQELRFHQYSRGDSFNLQEQINHLEDIYCSATNRDILEALRWCRRTYETKKNANYISFIPCSALGMMGRKYDPEKDDFYKDGDIFNPRKLDVVWTWILCNIGMKPVYDNYCLPYIPSYGEGIQLINMPQSNTNIRLVFDEKQEKERTRAIYKLYLSVSDFDHALYNHHEGDILPPPWPNPFVLHTIEMHERERIELIKRYLESHSN